MRDLLARLAVGAPVPVFPVAGGGTREALARLRLRPDVHLVDTPRHAIVLLVLGEFPPGEIAGLAAVHDMIPSPRVTVHWTPGGPRDDVPRSMRVDGDDTALVAALSRVAGEVLSGTRASEPPIRPDVDPVEWRGIGPYGHGGKGMTGGTPFGRPLAERAPDRDGLELDQLSVTVGPWLGALPPGLELGIKLQGDVIQEVEIHPPAVTLERPDGWVRALEVPVPVAELELDRARHHLVWLGEALRVHDLPALGQRTLRLAQGLTPGDRGEVERVLAEVRRTGIYRLALRGLGAVDPSQVGGLGPVARAAGLEDDARLDDPTYQELGFRPVSHRGADAADRWRQRIAEITQSLDLAGRAGDRTAFGDGVVEGPRGRITSDGILPGAVTVDLLPELLTGLEWGDAVAVVWSLDVDPTGVASRSSPEGAAA